ncbi:MAG: hypothetical protein N3I35_16080 [Clostridia bacterium]|nr:hypothetical protein [Clostridia bacterium]
MANSWLLDSSNVKLLGLGNGIKDIFKNKNSAFSYEDLPSNPAGANFGDVFSDNGYTVWEDIWGTERKARSASEQFTTYIKGLKPAEPKKAPNWSKIHEAKEKRQIKKGLLANKLYLKI